MFNSYSSIHLAHQQCLVRLITPPSLKHFIHLISRHHSFLAFFYFTGHFFSLSFSGYFLSPCSMNSGPFWVFQGWLLNLFFCLFTLIALMISVQQFHFNAIYSWTFPNSSFQSLPFPWFLDLYIQLLIQRYKPLSNKHFKCNKISTQNPYLPSTTPNLLLPHSSPHQ